MWKEVIKSPCAASCLKKERRSHNQCSAQISVPSNGVKYFKFCWFMTQYLASRDCAISKNCMTKTFLN